LVGNRSVGLERDISERDALGRLLRCVWADDLLVNEQLVADGLAIARRYPLDEAHADLLDSNVADSRSY
jgi:endonuclease YncB( thermonuclease family)